MKRNIIVIVGGISAFLLALTLMFISQRRATTFPTPAPTPTLFPTRSPRDVEQRPIIYTPNAGQALIDKIEHPRLLGDLQAKKDALKAKAQAQGGVISSTDTYVMRYIFAFNLIQVEITTLNTDQAKKDALAWLQGQGFDEKSMCELPVMFYLSPPVMEQLRGSSIPFNILPEGCV